MVYSIWVWICILRSKTWHRCSVSGTVARMFASWHRREKKKHVTRDISKTRSCDRVSCQALFSLLRHHIVKSNIPTPAADVTWFLKKTSDYKTVLGNTRSYGIFGIMVTRPLVTPIKFYVVSCHFLILSQISTPCHPISVMSILVLSSQAN
jgi:hypothetical protein